MSFTIHDVKLLLHCAVFIGLLLFSFNATDFQSARVYYDRLYFYQGNERKFCGKKLFKAVIVREVVAGEMR